MFRYALDRIKEQPPLDGPLSATELQALVGETVTPEGLGGVEALRVVGIKNPQGVMDIVKKAPRLVDLEVISSDDVGWEFFLTRLAQVAAGQRGAGAKSLLKRFAAMMQREDRRSALRAWRAAARRSSMIEDRAAALRRRSV